METSSSTNLCGYRLWEKRRFPCYQKCAGCPEWDVGVRLININFSSYFHTVVVFLLQNLMKFSHLNKIPE